MAYSVAKNNNKARAKTG